jgi:hypothetical protein
VQVLKMLKCRMIDVHVDVAVKMMMIRCCCPHSLCYPFFVLLLLCEFALDYPFVAYSPFTTSNQPSSFISLPVAFQGTYSLALEAFGPAKRESAAFAWSSFGNVHVVKIAQVFDKMVAAREALVANAVAAWYRTWVFGRTDAVDGGLVALEIGKSCEVCGRGAPGDFACPCSIVGVSRLVEIMVLLGT